MSEQKKPHQKNKEYSYPPRMTDEQKAVADSIAQQLGENEEIPRIQIFRLVWICGIDFAQEMLKEALETEAAGGMMVKDGTRRRTPGGVFFHLARNTVDFKTRMRIFEPKDSPKFKPRPPFKYERRIGMIRKLAAETGSARVVMMEMTGRLLEYEIFEDVVVAVLEYTGKVPQYPKGMIRPPKAIPAVRSFIAPHQWQDIRAYVDNPEDRLQVMGYCGVDPANEGLALYAVHVTTRERERSIAKRSKNARNGSRVPPNRGRNSSRHR